MGYFQVDMEQLGEAGFRAAKETPEKQLPSDEPPAKKVSFFRLLISEFRIFC